MENNNTNSPNQLRIYQLNCNASNDAQLIMLNSLNPNDWDIIALQEPYIDFNGVTRATPPWRVVYPSRHYVAPQETRSVMLINKKLATNHWEALPLNSSDLTAIRLSGEFGHVHVFNIYNDCNHSRTLHCLEQYLLSPPPANATQPQTSDIWVGDFNRHDPLWEHPNNAQLFTRANIDAADYLIDLLADFGMDIALEPGIPTLEHLVTKALHWVDHVFCSHDISPMFTRCEVLPHERPPKTDHFPIVSCIDLAMTRINEEPKRNFRDTDWEEFRKTLDVNLGQLRLRDPANIQDFDKMLTEVSDAITNTIEAHVPLRRPSPHCKRWWSKELAQARTALRTLAKKAYLVKKRFPNHPIIDEFKQARNIYVQNVKDARKQHWEDWVESTDRFTMWIINKFVTAAPSDGGSARIPTLKVKGADGSVKEVADNAGKSQALYNSFFFPPPEDDGLDPNFIYPPPKFQFHSISDAQILRAIRKLKPYKAPGPDGISNSVFTHCADLLTPWLGKLFRATFRLNHYPNEW